MYSPKSNLENNDLKDMQEKMYGLVQFFEPIKVLIHLIYIIKKNCFNVVHLFFCHTFCEVHHEMLFQGTNYFLDPSNLMDSDAISLDKDILQA